MSYQIIETNRQFRRGRDIVRRTRVLCLAPTPTEPTPAAEYSSAEAYSGRVSGDPYDNAMMESFFSTLLAELTDLERFATRYTARTAVFEFMEAFYNHQRLHSLLG